MPKDWKGIARKQLEWDSPIWDVPGATDSPCTGQSGMQPPSRATEVTMTGPPTSWPSLETVKEGCEVCAGISTRPSGHGLGTVLAAWLP